MPVQIVWDDAEHSIIRFVMSGKWSWQEFYSSYESIWDEVANIGHRVTPLPT